MKRVKGLDEIKFGFCMPIFAGAGDEAPRTPCYETLDYEVSRDAVLECERIGYDSVWVADHLFLGRRGAILECWTTLSALASITTKIRLGTIHLCNLFRQPSLMAKMAATLDVISKGRLEFFYDAGWNSAECHAYGIPWHDKAYLRMEAMDEALEVIKRMWTEDRASYEGKYYRVREAVCEPKPLQKPHPPIWIGVIGGFPGGEEESFQRGRERVGEEKALMTAAAKHADVWNNTPTTPEVYKKRLGVLKEYCLRVGRDYGEIRKSLETQVLIAEDEKELNKAMDRIKNLNPQQKFYGPIDVYEKFCLVGTPEDCIRQIEEFTDLGVTYFMLWFLDFPSLKGIRLFAEKVMPHFRSGS